MKKKFLVVISFFILSQNIFSTEKIRNYNETINFISELNSNFLVEKIDTVQYNDIEYPFYKISYNPLRENKGKKYLIISGVHGNEPAPVYAVKDFIVSLNQKEIVRQNLQIDFILIVNPFGFEFNQRYNGKNLDINRDLGKLETKEAQILTENCKVKDYDKVFDFHEANAKGFFLYCYGRKNNRLSTEILSVLKSNNVDFENEYKDKILKVKNGKLYVPFFASMYMKNIKTVTTGIYFSKSSNSFTFETSKNGKMEERKRIISIILNYILTDV
jgi:hypothetical protein